MTTGSCLCGTVRWRAEPPFGGLEHCHCSNCRKAHGAPFATCLSGRRDGFAWTGGEDAVVRYESSPGFMRAFCGRCGSVAPEHGAQGDEVYLPAGCLDEDPGIRPQMHIFVASKAPWYTIADGLPLYAARPRDGGPLAAAPPAGAGDDRLLRGSCLCGGVAFEADGPLLAVHNCHCSRCRKARAAAHTTNGFVPREALRILRGEDLIVSYKVPEAKFFTHNFCRTCGSGLPRANPSRDVVAIPFGALDSNPGRPGERHIFVAHKAPWFEIADALPQFPEAPPPA